MTSISHGVWVLAANAFAAIQFVWIPRFKPFAAKTLAAKPLAAAF